MRPSFGKYRVVAPIASGGMADVYRAELPGPGGFVKEVALKVVRGGEGDATSVPMFIQEARLASRLGHANIVQVLDFDRQGDRWYIAMELVRGHSLRAVVERCRAEGVRFGLPRAVQVGIEVARALAYAHRLEENGRPAGLVHRDVSPQNVLLSFEGEVKLADFGIAHAVSARELTAPGTLKGKLAYMAPEQARAEPVDGRTDVFALAVVLWELCAGRRLFARDGEAATLAAVTGSEPISPPSAWNEQVPPALDSALMGALARDRTLRTASAEVLERELAEVRHAQGWRPEDVDLRPLMRRLWPEGSAPPSMPPLEPLERTAPGKGLRAAMTRLEGTAVMPGGRAPVVADPAGMPGADGDPAEAPTLTLRRAVPRRSALLLGGAALLSIAVAGGGWWRSRRPLPDRSGSVQGAARPPSPSPSRATGGEAAGERPTSTSTPAPTSTPTPTSTSAPTSTSTSTSPGSPGREAVSGAPSRTAPSLAHATLTINAWPWATVRLDGELVGDTPKELRLGAGPHRVELTHPTLSPLSRDFDLPPGAHRTWSARMKR